jgi:hypothetical protein
MRLALFLCGAALFWWAPTPYYVRVVDGQTGRGVPLVELRTLDEVGYYTDSNGIAVVDEPAFDGRRVFFKIRSHGYEFPEKVEDETGTFLTPAPGTHADLKLKRVNVAERLYRMTGEGIYRDSVLAGLPVPIRQPLLNGLVVGQDTAIAIPYGDKLVWCWGDTFGLADANFNASCATAEREGLDPDTGINFTYFINESGFSKPMLTLPRPGLVWLEGLFTVKDERGRERLVATYTRQHNLDGADERGVAVFNDERQEFEVLAQLPWRRPHLSSHPFRYAEGGRTYWYPYPNQRVPDDWMAIQRPEAWEALSPDGTWKAGAEPVRNPVRLLDADTGADTGASASSVAWNDFRKKWILLAERTGTVYYAEADRPTGPWSRAKLIVSHTQYNFYNVVQHPFLGRDGGRSLYFEGTYTDAFSGAKEKTPRYNYNQIMYRLRLDDPRLALEAGPAPRK